MLDLVISNYRSEESHNSHTFVTDGKHHPALNIKIKIKDMISNFIFISFNLNNISLGKNFYLWKFKLT